MRDFTDMTVIPATHFIAVDGEGYTCAPFEVADIRGKARTVPGGRVLAIHWWGAHGHGQVEGHGPAEGFDDRVIVERYLAAWLAARAVAKRAQVAALERHRDQQRVQAASWGGAVASLRTEITDATAELTAANTDRKSQVQARLDSLNRGLAASTDALASAEAAAGNQDAIDSATTAADSADTEARSA